MITLGIDPGASGSIVRLDDIDGPSFVRLSETESDIANWLREWSVQRVHAFIERVSSSPQMGVVSAFTFGKGYGYLRGLLVAMRIPFEEVTPRKWQSEMGCLTKGDKNVSKSRAQQLFPQVKVTHANADALLIAEFGRRVLNQRNGLNA